MESFAQLEVWQKAHALVLEIYKFTASFPTEERFRLTDQLCRSAASIPANIVHPVEYGVLGLFHGARAKVATPERSTSSSYTSPALCNYEGPSYFTGLAVRLKRRNIT